MDTLSDMSVFVEVVRAGSFKGAAEKTGLTSSGVSRKIGRFEDRLGARLFYRTTRAVSLSEAGEVLYERGEKIIESLRDAEDVVRDLSGQPKGQIRIASSAAFTTNVLVPFLSAFSKEFDEITATFLQADGGIDIIGERVDLALLFEQPTETTVISSKVFDDPWIVCASPEYLARKGMPEAPHDLKDHGCLTIHASRQTYDEWKFVENGKPVTVKVESICSGIGMAMREAVLQGLGVARLAHFLVCQDVLDGKLVPLLSPYWPKCERAIYAVYPNREYLPTKTRLFLDHLQIYMLKTMIKIDG